jgi:renalase
VRGPARYVAVIGAGMAGAACARGLTDRGHVARVLDKGRAVGGRMAQRRVGGAVFDHGAQYLTVRDPAFAAAAEGWRAAGALAPWPGVTGGDGTPAEVGVPAMSAPAKLLLAGLEVAVARRVVALRREPDGRWTLRDEAGGEAGPFDAVALAVPAPQAADLLATDPAAARLRDALSGVVIEPCWSALLALPAPFRPEVTGERLADETLAWVARTTSKPGRGGAEAWTLHATPAWSRRHLELTPDEVAPLLAAALARILGPPPEATHLAAHRWRYALASRPLGEPCLFDADLGLGLCGDWCLGPRVEAAFLSGAALAERMAA